MQKGYICLYLRRWQQLKKNTMEFNKEKYKIYTWKNWMVLHWILNPGLAINELILGQRVPKISLR